MTLVLVLTVLCVCVFAGVILLSMSLSFAAIFFLPFELFNPNYHFALPFFLSSLFRSVRICFKKIHLIIHSFTDSTFFIRTGPGPFSML